MSHPVPTQDYPCEECGQQPDDCECENKKYQIIYADPPWSYRHCASKSRKIENQYPTMNLEEIKNLQIPGDDNSVLYLWATTAKLEEALQVMNEWKYDYRSSLVWDKQIIGMEYWFRGQHELLLVGVKGKVSPPEQSLRVSSVLRKRRTKHSKKPNIIKEWINKWYPDKTKIELFAREKTPGWDVWGNEVESDIEL